MAMTYLQQPTCYIPARDMPAGQRSARSVTEAPKNELAPAEHRSLGLGAIVVIVAIVVAAVVGFGSDAAASGPVDVLSESSQISDTIEIYVVQPGDTLWSIASAIALPGEDVRPLVDALQQTADGSDLDVGQRLVIDHAMIRR